EVDGLERVVDLLALAVSEACEECEGLLRTPYRQPKMMKPQMPRFHAGPQNVAKGLQASGSPRYVTCLAPSGKLSKKSDPTRKSVRICRSSSWTSTAILRGSTHFASIRRCVAANSRSAS